jgi:phosphatidate phosphatase PAH1
MTHRVIKLANLRRACAAALLTGAAALLVGCGSSDSGPGSKGPTCASLGIQDAVVTDIDETLTTSDGEFIHQTLDGNYDPLERKDGAKLMQGYSKRGYFIFYLTARSKMITLNKTGQSATDATRAWLKEHGYPLGSDRSKLQLDDTLETGEAVRTYKAKALKAMQDAGYAFDYAYGNAITDIEAYNDAGISKAETFIIGTNAGADGTVAVQGDDWTQHEAAQLPNVNKLCSF